jgi:hypothetical protein
VEAEAEAARVLAAENAAAKATAEDVVRRMHCTNALAEGGMR